MSPDSRDLATFCVQLPAIQGQGGNFYGPGNPSFQGHTILMLIVSSVITYNMLWRQRGALLHLFLTHKSDSANDKSLKGRKV